MERIAKLLPTGPKDKHSQVGARRKSRRFPLNARVRLPDRPVGRRPGDEAHGVALNASVGGLRVTVDHQLEVGSETTLEIDFGDGRITQEEVRVVWSRDQPDGHIVGVEFLDQLGLEES